MKKLILALFISLFIIPLCAQESVPQNEQERFPQLKVLIVADTWDDLVGEFAEKQFEELNDWLDDMVSYALEMPVSSESAYLDGSLCNYDTIINVLENFQCDTEDIVIFWYLGHGIRSVKDTSKFPQICPHTLYDDQFISLEAIKNHIMKNKPRLCVVVGDCCNSYDEDVTPKSELVFASRNSRDIVTKTTKDFARALFGESEGCYIISASSAGEFSYSNKNEGFFFTHQLIKSFKALSSKGEVSENPWDDLMERLQTHFDTTGVLVAPGKREFMHPQYRFEPRVEIHPRKEYVYYIDNNLVDALQLIIKDSVNDYTDEVMTRYFADDAVIITLGSDKTSILEVLPAKDYLERIKFFDNLDKISVRATYTNDDKKVKKLLVHEIYIENNYE